MIKIRHTFYAYDNGVEINCVNGTSMINNISEAKAKARVFLKKHYDESDDMTIVIDQQNADIGVIILAGKSNINPDMAFLLIINRI